MTITTLAELIAAVESNDNRHAVRYEPNYSFDIHLAYRMAECADHCSFGTARILCQMSWGKYQIMGAMLMSLGLEVSPLQFVQDDAMQDDFFNRYIAADHLTLTLADILGDPSKRSVFARLYNGPGNTVGYSARIVQVAKAHGLQVVE